MILNRQRKSGPQGAFPETLIFAITVAEGNKYWHLVGRAMDAAKQYKGQPPTTKNYLVQYINIAEVKKPQHRQKTLTWKIRSHST